MEIELRAIALALRWADRRGIDLEERLGTATLLRSDEVLSLRDALRLKARGGAGEVVNAGTHHTRIRYVHGYLVWRAQHVIQKIPNEDGRFLPARLRLEDFSRSMLSELGRTWVLGREGLADGVEERLRAAIHPDSAHNPYQPRHRARNYALLLTYLELGIRLSEAMVIKGADVVLSGERPMVTIHRRADDKADKRGRQPLTKTAARVLPIGEGLRAAVEDWILRHRPDPARYPGAKKTPFVFVSRTGQPIGMRTVGDIVERLRTIPEMPPNLSAHILRHTWNDRFSVAADEVHMSEAEEISQRNYLMGWRKDSKQAETYTRRHTRKKASQSSLALQRKSYGEGER